MGAPPPGVVKCEFAIGIYTGDSPFELGPHPEAANPVLTRKSVSDLPAGFVADPFIIKEQDTWYMFFEVLDWERNEGAIAMAKSSDGLAWTYQQVVLREPGHLSYPCVFKWQDVYYMVPETLWADELRLYKADRFPSSWSVAGILLDGQYADPTILHYDGVWWLFACTEPFQHDTLRLYFSEELLGSWHEHPCSPLVQKDARTARPAGKILQVDDRLIRFAQDCYPKYGTQVRGFEITELGTMGYAERELPESPVITPSGKGWNAQGMHHIDLHSLEGGRWLACVDGWVRSVD